MATYAGVAIGQEDATPSGRIPEVFGTTHSSPVLLSLQASDVEPYNRGGSNAYAGEIADRTGWLAEFSGTTLESKAIGQPRVAAITGWLAEFSGSRYEGRKFVLSTVYRQGDKTTLVGHALDLAGQPLRQVQLQFIGETVQGNYFGSGTNLDGVFIAYLDAGDTFTAYAYDTVSGTVWRLLSKQETPNQTNLVFQAVTKRGGFGEGLFKRSA